jgi:Domain of unknown function (DUF5655)
MRPVTAPLWTCPVCGQSFVSANLPHSCAVAPLEQHFARSAPEVRAAFAALLAAARDHGPLTINATKSRITLQVRFRFVAVDAPRRAHLTGHLVLTRAVPSPAATRIDFVAPYYHLHRFRLERPEDVGPELRALLAEAYGVGEQRHLTDPEWPRQRLPGPAG